MTESTSDVRTVAVDLAKHVFHVAGEDQFGKVLFDRALKSRQAFATLLRGLPAGTRVLMETGPGAQAWARECQRLGLVPRILPAQRVKEHTSGSKNDRKDTHALLRAGRDATIEPVPIKTTEVLALQALHRVRSGYTKRRTAIANQIRGLLLEHGIVLAKGDAAIEIRLPRLLEDASVPLPDLLRELLDDLLAEWRVLGERIAQRSAAIETEAKADPQSRRLMSVWGVGPLIASAVACKQLDINRFANGRSFAAYFGIIPNQHSTGGRTRLGKMSRRGDGYIRSMLVSGAQSVLRQVKAGADDVDSKRLLRWINRHGRKGAAVRLANRNLRIMWALLRKDSWFERSHRHTRADASREEAVA
jgi:transposase